MTAIFALIVALALSMAITPVMIRLAPRIGMVDLPDPRKVHAMPIPRVGGIGIAAGALVAMFVFLPADTRLLSYAAGALVLVASGAWDDIQEMGHYRKFVGQFIAASLVVYGGDLWVSMFPFVSEPLPPWIGKPFTVVALVGVINAINHSDGLDGLAGGESLLSLAATAYLAFLAQGRALMTMCFAVMGGVIGFLRFNTFPARVFMGDAGSQFLGFTLGVVVILLTQEVDTAAAKALGGLLIGLPIIDILAVFAQRVYHRMNWFRATKNHIHHRLLQIGFHHYEAVAIIYGIQGFFMVSAVLFAYEFDAFIVALYFVTCAIVFLLVWRAERSGWRAHTSGSESRLARLMNAAGSHWLLARLPLRIVRLAVPLYIVLAAVLANNVPESSAVPVVLVAALVVLGLLFARLSVGLQAFRLAVYAGIAVLAYVLQNHAPFDSFGMKVTHAILFGGLAITVWLVVRFARELQFATSPMDVLVILILLSAAVFAQLHGTEPRMMYLVIEAMILFYGTELIIQLGSQRWYRVLGGAALAALGILGAKLALT